MPEASFAVAIIGGGVAGSATALTLRRAGLGRVCIVETSDFSAPRIGETIPPDTNALLHALGVWNAFAAQGHLPCYGSHSLWGSNQLGHNDFLTSPYGHGWHLDRTRFDRLLLEKAVEAGVTVIRRKCHAIQGAKDRVTAAQTGDSTIRARWFVDASGRAAMISRACGIGRTIDDRQTVIWARFQGDGVTLGNSTWLESVLDGWWYAAELPGAQAVVALGTDPQVAKAQGLYELHRWAVALSGTDLISRKIARAHLIPGSFRITASHSYVTRRTVGGNWLAVGDAASAFDPLSSAGIYKAISTGQRAANAILSQDPAMIDAYQASVHSSYAQYLQEKARLYAAEGRWPNAPFWRTRSPCA